MSTVVRLSSCSGLLVMEIFAKNNDMARCGGGKRGFSGGWVAERTKYLLRIITWQVWEGKGG